MTNQVSKFPSDAWSAEAIDHALVASGFGDRALGFVTESGFQANEISYKRRLASSIRSAMDSLHRQNNLWRKQLSTALKSPENNIIDWRTNKVFLSWCGKYPQAARTALVEIWNESLPIADRIKKFSITLSDAGLTQPGKQISVVSVLLMAIDPSDYPPVKVTVMSRMLEMLRLPKISDDAAVAYRYQLFMVLLDRLVSYSSRGQHPLTDRLEAQGAVWCAIGKGDPPSRNIQLLTSNGGGEANAERDITAASNELAMLDSTEREAVVAARRGQGRYRKALLRYWNGCAVTGCTSVEILRASHLKPWHKSDNQERLDQYNGLLLVPNLDLALDRALIAFTDAGEILISAKLSRADRKALNLHSRMRLRRVHANHKQFLMYHRDWFLLCEANYVS